MNVHHLELFYYVARHGGVSVAARHMPYGIQQPAISSQILQLESSLGVVLFQRRPFKLTPQGEQLYTFIQPFFSGLERLGNDLAGGKEKLLRIAAPEIVQRDYLPGLLGQMKKREPGFQFRLSTGRLSEIEGLLLEQEIDLGVAMLSGALAEGIQSRILLQMPMQLLVEPRSRWKDAGSILKQDRIDLPLITLPQSEPLARSFQAELRRRKVDWYPSIEVTSLDMISRYVAKGFGVGLSLATPLPPNACDVRILPLEGFPELTFGALWLGRLSPLAEIFLEEAESLVRSGFSS